MSNQDWNPGLYLKFQKERNQPSIDLVSRIDLANPKSIIDIGCGPGNSTQILARRWPGSRIIGIDNSPSMIETAVRDYPGMEWLLLDASKDEIPGKYDLVFSNAAIQWIPDHEKLLRKFKGVLTENGVLAVQVPLFFDMPVGISLLKISSKPEWNEATAHVTDLFSIHNYVEYYDLLTGLFNSVEIWESDYIHVMDSHESILEMIRSTGLRPYLERLSTEADQTEFKKEVLNSIKEDYHLQADGNVLFPFKRLFFIAVL
jgi:trans-aconitate 2-methyltransferase